MRKSSCKIYAAMDITGLTKIIVKIRQYSMEKMPYQYDARYEDVINMYNKNVQSYYRNTFKNLLTDYVYLSQL